MIRCAWKYLRFSPSRSLLIVSSVALGTVLMTFLCSVYRGVSDGTLDYILQNRCDLWVLQENATNIVRGSSILPAKQSRILSDLPGVGSLSPLLLFLSVVRTPTSEGTVYLVGYDLRKPLGGPPRVVIGRAIERDYEIVLDDCFAAKYGILPGDTVICNRQKLEVVGLSEGTNAFVIQYAFVTLTMAQRLVGDLKIVSAFLVNAADSESVQTLSNEITSRLPKSSVFTHEQFVSANRREMQSGFLPFIIAVCIISVAVLVIILSSLLSLMIMERRADFAVMKTLGASAGFLPGLILNLSAQVATIGIVAGIFLFLPVTSLIRLIAPELRTVTTFSELALVISTVFVTCLLSGLFPMQKLRTIYPAETLQ